jgi:glutamate synthase domain-containing protein 1
LNKKFGKLKHYSVSLSSRTIIYKGMLISAALANFYEDLGNEDYLT